MIGTLGKIWALFTAAERRKAVIMLILVVLVAAAETLGVLSIMPFLSVLGRPEAVQEHIWLRTMYEKFGFSRTRDFIVALGLASVVIVLASSLFKAITMHWTSRFVHFQRHSISSRLLGTYLHQPYEFFLTRNPSHLSKNVLSEVDHLAFDLIQPLSQLVAQGVVVLAMGVLIFLYDPWMAICILVAIGILYGSIYSLVRGRLSRIGTERQAANAARYQACGEMLGGIKDMKVTHSTEGYLARFRSSSREFSRHSATAETLSSSPLYIVEAAGYSGLIVIALALLMRSESVGHVLPALGLYGFTAYRILPSAQIMYRGFARLRFSSAALDNIQGDLESKQSKNTSDNQPRFQPSKEIRLRGVSYAYPTAPNYPVLDNFDLVIPTNTSIGITGRSGAGKSTVMDLLLGLLTPQAGRLTVDHIEIDESNVGAWQRSIGYVPQTIYLADASVAENIAFGVPKDQINIQAVQRAARAAQIHTFVSQHLPNSYDTTIGDRGTRLSGGQRQRIGIARALYHDPPVLLMDEATSALDAETEDALNAAISELSGHKTIVVIAHKRETLRRCQTIVEINSRPRCDNSSLKK